MGKKITAGEVLSPGFIDNVAMHGEGFRVLRKLRGSPPYWESAKKDIFAMIKQLSTPTRKLNGYLCAQCLAKLEKKIDRSRSY